MRVGVLAVVTGMMAAACDAPAPEPAPAPKLPKVVAREAFAVPPEERPTLGKVGDTECVNAANELPLQMDEKSCLSLLTDTIKNDGGAMTSELKLARIRAAYFQPGPIHEGETVGWVLYAIKIHCPTSQVDAVGNVIYRPDGVEISRAIPEFGTLELPEGPTKKKLRDTVCAS